LLTESATIAVAGATFGVILALGAVHWGVAALPPGVVRTTDIHVSAGVLVFTGALAVMTGMAFGILPALRAAAGSAQSVLGTRGSSRETAHHRLSAALVAGEVALAVLLAITAGLLTRSFAHLRDLSPGFRTERVVSALISPPPASYKDVTRATAFYTNVLDRVSAMPGVTSAALVDRLPIAGPVYGMGARVQGQFEDAKRLLPTVNHVLTITPSYLSVFGIPVVQGRALDDGDRAGATPVVLVSQSLARRFWPKGEAVGKRIGYPYQSPWLTIVGVVPDVRIDSLRDTASMTVYVPFSQRTAFANSEMSIVVRTSAEPQAIANGLRDIVASIDRAVPVTRVRAMNDVVAQSVAKPRFTAFLVGGFALAALLLGATGIYGVMSYIVSQRAHEMGVRMALGATPTDIVRLVLGRGTLLAGAGAAVGCAMALVATRALRSLLFGVSATDPLTFFGAVSVFILVAVSASAFPARRATRADPVQSLRQD
jgi:predicted permease